MLSKILIMGGHGNMGRRYQAILDRLGVSLQVFDPPDRCRYYANLKEALEWCDGVIIATPTKVHYQNFMETLAFSAKGVAILCEKPFSISLDDVELCRSVVEREGIKFQMVNQYEFLNPANYAGETRYDYFHSGTDGIYWDCINLIGLDKTGNVILKNDSPVWHCWLNGKLLDRREIDSSYVKMVEKWLENPTSNVDYMVEAHRKTLAMIAASRES